MSSDRAPGETRACTLVLGVLTIESSGDSDLELPANGVSDTVQFWIAPTTRWKIRTYAVSHNVHAWHLAGLDATPDAVIEFAVAHINKHYADILVRIVTIEFPHATDPANAPAALAAHGLGGTLQEAQSDADRFAFWTPDGAVYMTLGSPES